MRKYDISLESVELSPQNVGAADCVLIITNHSVLDLRTIGSCAKLVVDTRDAMASVPAPRARIVKA